jgi:hypothetical protein
MEESNVNWRDTYYCLSQINQSIAPIFNAPWDGYPNHIVNVVNWADVCDVVGVCLPNDMPRLTISRLGTTSGDGYSLFKSEPQGTANTRYWCTLVWKNNKKAESDIAFAYHMHTEVLKYNRIYIAGGTARLQNFSAPNSDTNGTTSVRAIGGHINGSIDVEIGGGTQLTVIQSSCYNLVAVSFNNTYHAVFDTTNQGQWSNWIRGLPGTLPNISLAPGSNVTLTLGLEQTIGTQYLNDDRLPATKEDLPLIPPPQVNKTQQGKEKGSSTDEDPADMGT